MTWRVPLGAWKGERCFILGGGASLNAVDVARMQGQGRVIAVNNAYLKAPWADLLYFADRRWYEWHRDSLSIFQGPYIVTRQQPKRPAHDIKLVKRDISVPLSRSPRSVAGFCSGSNSANIAYLFGSLPIYLVGFDMTPGNWHSDHRVPQKPDFARRFLPYWEHMAVELAKEGVPVFNTTPGSLLDCFPFADLADVLGRAA